MPVARARARVCVCVCVCAAMCRGHRIQPVVPQTVCPSVVAVPAHPSRLLATAACQRHTHVRRMLPATTFFHRLPWSSSTNRVNHSTVLQIDGGKGSGLHSGTTPTTSFTRGTGRGRKRTWSRQWWQYSEAPQSPHVMHKNTEVEPVLALYGIDNNKIFRVLL